MTYDSTLKSPHFQHAHFSAL